MSHYAHYLDVEQSEKRRARVYFEILNEIVHNKDIDEEIRREAQDFLSW